MINVIDKIKEHLKIHNKEAFECFSESLSLDTDLIEESIYDSMGFMELMVYLMEECKKEIDFDNLDPDKIAKIRYLTEIFNV